MPNRAGWTGQTNPATHGSLHRSRTPEPLHPPPHYQAHKREWAAIGFRDLRDGICPPGERFHSDLGGYEARATLRGCAVGWPQMTLMQQAFPRKLVAPREKNMVQLWDNPIGTDGFEFVEYTAPDVSQLHALFEQMGFRAVGRHRSKAVTLYRQGGINFVVNAEPESHGARFAQVHGPSACAMAFRVKDAAAAYRKLTERGAKPFANQVGPMELNIPAIEGIGGSVIYLVDRYGERSIYDVDFLPSYSNLGFEHKGAGLTYIDHVTHNVFRGNMDQWAGFYERLFDFREIRYFDIEGKLTGLKSKAMTSPCGKIRIPINESADDKSQIQEYLVAYHGEGIQHVALGTRDIYRTVETLRRAQV